ncbi:hypothetical protein RRF57_008623 [Xylaria bambusicola]|uniref:Uncharacterized protein n=1 Tax=Xylaria bambusicola TaxID=326684 RepID=A0AAN7UYA9_9PEZI
MVDGRPGVVQQKAQGVPGSVVKQRGEWAQSQPKRNGGAKRTGKAKTRVRAARNTAQEAV